MPLFTHLWVIAKLYDFNCFVEYNKIVFNRVHCFFAHTIKVKGALWWFVLDPSGFHCFGKNSWNILKEIVIQVWNDDRIFFFGQLALYRKPNTIHQAIMKIIYNKFDYYFKYNKTGHNRTQATLYHKFCAVWCNLSFPSTERLWEIWSRLIAFNKHPTLWGQSSIRNPIQTLLTQDVF